MMSLGPHPLGAFHGSPRVASQLAVVGATVLAAFLGRLQLAWRDLESSTWWASNGRDVLVLFALVVQALALVGVGMPLAAAVITSAQLSLLAVLAESALLRLWSARGHDALAVGAAVLVVLPVALAPQRTFALLERLVLQLG